MAMLESAYVSVRLAVFALELSINALKKLMDIFSCGYLVRIMSKT